MKTKRTLAALLLMSMLASAMSCGDTTEPETDTQPENSGGGILS